MATYDINTKIWKFKSYKTEIFIHVWFCDNYNLITCVVADGNSVWFVDFYAPWCPPCLRLLPELRKASQTFDPVVRFGTVDCTIHKALCQQHNVQSYPTTVLFNQSQPAQFFRGEHSASSITDFLQDIISPRGIFFFYLYKARKGPDWFTDINYEALSTINLMLE